MPGGESNTQPQHRDDAAPHDYLRKGEPAHPHTAAIAGALAGLVSRNVIAPIDTVKIRMQVTPVLRHAQRTTLWGEVRAIWRHEGPRAFWKGNVPGSAMYVVYNGVQFAAYARLNELLAGCTGESRRVHAALCGALAGCAAAVGSYPLDVLRTRLAASRAPRLVGVRESVRAVWRHEGVLGFFRGSATAVCSVGVATGIVFGTYETVRIVAEEGRARARCTSLGGVSRRDTRYPTPTPHHDADTRYPTPHHDADTAAGAPSLHSDGGSDASAASATVAYTAYTALGHLASPLSGLVSKLATFPLDTVRRRIVLKDSAHLHLVTPGSAGSAESRHVAAYLGKHARAEGQLHVPECGQFWRVARQVHRGEGLRGMYRGVGVALVKSVPSTAVTLWAYEAVRAASEASWFTSR